MRIRRDDRNFILERQVTVKEGRGKGQKRWLTEGFYSSLLSLLVNGLPTLPRGSGAKELLASLDENTELLLNALDRAILDGSLSSDVKSKRSVS